MVLGALIDAGVALEDVRRALGSLAISPESVWTEPVVRAGIRATKFCVVGEEHAHSHSHAAVHHHDHHSLAEINQLVDRSALSASGKARAKGLFQQLGEAE